MAKRIILITLLLMLSGCWSQKVFNGTRAEEEVGFLDTRNVAVKSVDGHEVSDFSHGILLLAGRHELIGWSSPGGYHGAVDPQLLEHRIYFDTVPSGRYLVKASSNYGKCIWVEEEMTGKIVSVDEKGCGAYGRTYYPPAEKSRQ
jgi:hypothetical protein